MKALWIVVIAIVVLLLWIWWTRSNPTACPNGYALTDTSGGNITCVQKCRPGEQDLGTQCKMPENTLYRDIVQPGYGGSTQYNCPKQMINLWNPACAVCPASYELDRERERCLSPCPTQYKPIGVAQCNRPAIVYDKKQITLRQ